MRRKRRQDRLSREQVDEGQKGHRGDYRRAASLSREYPAFEVS
jgi:hypothetical protein